MTLTLLRQDYCYKKRAREKREMQMNEWMNEWMIRSLIYCCVQDNYMQGLIAQKVPLLNWCLDSLGCAWKGLIGNYANDGGYLLDH
jgi:hypothetical protein